MIIKLMSMLWKHAPVSVVRFCFNLYVPFLGAGIKVEEISDNFQYLRVRLKLRFYNKNYVGTQYGGSIYSMTDPHYMFLIINNLGPAYNVLDKAASIDYVKLGKTDLIAEFRIDDALINTIKDKTKDNEKYIFDLPVTVVDTEGQTIATLVRTLYVRKKRENIPGTPA